MEDGRYLYQILHNFSNHSTHLTSAQALETSATPWCQVPGVRLQDSTAWQRRPPPPTTAFNLVEIKNLRACAAAFKHRGPLHFNSPLYIFVQRN